MKKQETGPKAYAALPSMDFVFDIQVTGVESKINWVGKFVYKRPTLGARSRIDVMRTRLNGDLQNVDDEVRDYNDAVSYLRYTLADYPEWWSESQYGLDLYDGNVVSEIYNKCMEFENEWKKKVFGGKASAVEVSDDPVKREAQEASAT